MLVNDGRLLRRSCAATLLIFTGQVFAEVRCAEADRSKWMAESAYRERMKEHGVQITKFVITTGNCYEIYGFDKSGKKIEVYSNPVDGSLIVQNNYKSDL